MITFIREKILGCKINTGVLEGYSLSCSSDGFNAINKDIVLSWQSALLDEKAKVPRENDLPAASHWQTSSSKLY